MAKTTVGGVDRLAFISSGLLWTAIGVLIAGDLARQWSAILLTVIIAAVVITSYVKRSGDGKR